MFQRKLGIVENRDDVIQYGHFFSSQNTSAIHSLRSLSLYLVFTLSLLKTRNAVYRESNFMSTKFIFVLFILSFNFHLSFFSLRITCNRVFGWFTKCRWTLFFWFCSRSTSRFLSLTVYKNQLKGRFFVVVVVVVFYRGRTFYSNKFIRFFFLNSHSPRHQMQNKQRPISWCFFYSIEMECPAFFFSPSFLRNARVNRKCIKEFRKCIIQWRIEKSI